MSNSLAVAAVTATLRNLLTQGIRADSDLDDTTVTMQPVDLARAEGATANQLNVFLYHMVPSPAWRNMDMPGRTRNGETAIPPLALNLYYLITAYGRDNDALRPFSHQLLGRAMTVLLDHPLLGADEIKAALPGNDLWQQVERVRFTLQPLLQDELSKLWTGFQTGFRLSMAYEATVVLIESGRSIRAPLPVLARGSDDTGATVQGSLKPPYPTLGRLVLPGRQDTLVVGDTLILLGSQLLGTGAQVLFDHPMLAQPVVVAPQQGATDDELRVIIPDDPANWLPGFYRVSVRVLDQDAMPRRTNALAVALAPTITTPLPLTAKVVRGTAKITLACKPELLAAQHVSLLLGDREIQATDRTGKSDKVTFTVTEVQAGTSLRLRLRVDGVDSAIIDRTKTPPAFDDTCMVKF